MDTMNSGFFNGATELMNYVYQQASTLEKACLESEMKLVDIGGTPHYWDRSARRYVPVVAPVPEDAPVPEPYTFFTLDGIVDYIKANVEGLIPSDSEDDLILHVVDQCTVRLMSHPSVNQKKRYCIAKCEAHVPLIRFGQWLDSESFNTMLLSTFIPTDSREVLFKVISNLIKEQNCNLADDGVSQVVTVKQGITTASNITFKNPVCLQPMRTFPEVDQPESNFTLRVNENALISLHEADGGAWKNEAVANIKEYLQDKLLFKNVVVIA